MVENKKKISPRGEAAQKGNEQKKRFEKEKARAYELEKENYTQIILFASTGGWWKMGGNSALYYTYYLAKQLKKEARLQPDSDYYSKFWTGIVSIRDIEGLEKKFEKELKIKLNKNMSNTHLKVFDLGYKVAEDTIENMRHMRENQMRSLNSMVIPEVQLPGLQSALYEGLQITYYTNKNIPVEAREMLGAQMTERARTTVVNYTLVANGVINKEEGLKKIWLSVNMLMSDAKTMAELDIWPIERCLRVTSEWAKAKKIIQKELKKDE